MNYISIEQIICHCNFWVLICATDIHQQATEGSRYVILEIFSLSNPTVSYETKLSR